MNRAIEIFVATSGVALVAAAVHFVLNLIIRRWPSRPSSPGRLSLTDLFRGLARRLFGKAEKSVRAHGFFIDWQTLPSHTRRSLMGARP